MGGSRRVSEDMGLTSSSSQSPTKLSGFSFQSETALESAPPGRAHWMLCDAWASLFISLSLKFFSFKMDDNQ